MQPILTPPTSSGAHRFLFWLLVVLTCIVGWGKLDVWLASWLHFSIGGGGSGAFRVLLVGYVATRLVSRDAAWTFEWARDPFIWLYLLAAVSPLWVYADPAWPSHWPAHSHDTTDVLTVVLPGLTAYLTTRYLLDRNFSCAGFPLLRALIVALTLVTLQILVTSPSTLLDFSQVDSMYEHHTHVAMRMVMAIPITIAFLMFDRGVAREGRLRALDLALLVLQIVGLTIANSRIGWLALAAVGVYGIVYGTTPRMRRWFLFALLLMCVLALLHPKVRGNFFTLFHITQEENYQRRLVVYGTDVKLIERHPLLGIGFSSQNFLYRGRALEGETWEYDHPHDLFLQFAVYLGLPGVLLLGWVLLTLGRAMIALGRGAPASAAPLVSGLRGALLGLLVMNVAETALSSERVAFMLAVLLGIITAWAGTVSRENRPLGEIASDNGKTSPTVIAIS